MRYTVKKQYFLPRRSLLRLNLFLIILITVFSSRQLFSQKANEKSDGAGYKEELYVRTDRDTYITGEQVWFKVYKMDGLTNALSDISKVVYFELLDKNNFPLKQIKVQVDGNSGSSVINLPANLSSGNYLIRAYTNWMKNYPVEKFFYKEISVINPFENIENLKLPSDSISRALNKKSQNPAEEISNDRHNNANLIYAITLQKPDYTTRDKVRIAVSVTDISGKPVETDLSLSVVKTAIVNPLSKSINIKANAISPDTLIIRRIDEVPLYLPELEGHLINGFMRLKSNDEPLRKTDLSLSYVGKNARCQFSKTDENGEFYFLATATDLSEIVIQPLSSDITGYYVELKQPFSSSFSNAKASEFYIDSSKIGAINNAVISMQINNIYEPFREKSNSVTKTIAPDFYGEPENTIKMADYIELTSVREVVKEIIPNVYTLKQNGKFDFKLINKFKGQPFENKPLILVDGVPVYDFEKVLSINSKEIERADVINTRYFFSENVFDGIVSFATKKGNLSAMEFNNSIFRQVYEGYQVKGSFYSPDYSSDTLRTSRIPDFRNTLYWNPDLHTTKDGKTETEFYTSDESVEYTIVVEGIAPDGKKGISSALLIVR
jgi:hypothetical protein